MKKNSKEVKKSLKKNKNILKLKTLITKKNIMIFSILLIATIVFFQYQVIITTDGKYYYFLSKCLAGEVAMQYWHPIRGFGYPLIILITNTLFGDNPQGLLIGAYIFYIIFIVFFYKILNNILDKNKIKKRGLYYFLFCLLIVFNPLIIGFTHTLMTEAVMPLIYLLTFYLCLKWYNVTKYFDKKNIIYNILFIILSILIWFIKQPYIFPYLAAIFLTACASAISNKNLLIFFKKVSTMFFSAIFIFVSINIWDNFLVDNYSTSSLEKETVLISSVVSGLNYHFSAVSKDEFCNTEFIQNNNFYNDDKNKLEDIMEKYPEDWCNYVGFYRFKSSNDSSIYFVNGETKPSISKSIKLYFTMFKDHPFYAFNSYFQNYLAIIGIKEISLEGGYYHASKDFLKFDDESVDCFEIKDFGLATFKSNDIRQYTDFGDIEGAGDVANNYNGNTGDKGFLSDILIFNFKYIIFPLLKILMLLVLPLFIYFFIKFIMTKRKNYFVIMLISGITFINNIFYVLLGTIIDRYVYPLGPLMLLAFMIIIMVIQTKIRHRKLK